MFWKNKSNRHIRHHFKKHRNVPLNLNSHLMNDIGFEPRQEMPSASIWPKGW